ncbi:MULTISPECIES: hypothetical protein [Kribbella]|uniref:hypothetical protein n=1 Tax=Kribbella TaxID=182639 RepID=UPI0013054035|nr:MULTISPECIES: hypothetical protein [Kribbella]
MAERPGEHRTALVPNGVRSLCSAGVDLLVESDAGATDSDYAASGARIASRQRVLADADVVITTARVPGRIPPLLVTDEALTGMRPGSVVIDLAARDLDGNVAGSVPEQTITTTNGVTVIGARNLASPVPMAASSVYSHNIVATADHLLVNGAVSIDRSDPVQAGIVLTHEHQVLVKEARDELQPVR